MELPPIVQAGHPVLRARALEVLPARIPMPEFQELIDLMIATMRAAPGVGLAAPQIGIGLQIIVLEDRPEFLATMDPEELAARGRVPFDTRVFINPVLERVGDQRAMYFEGCLSVAGFTALVDRALDVVVSGLDRHGKPQTWRASGWPARILQHECDHLEGTLYLDRMKSRSFSTIAQAMRSYSEKPVEEIRRILELDRKPS